MITRAGARLAASRRTTLAVRGSRVASRGQSLAARDACRVPDQRSFDNDRRLLRIQDFVQPPRCSPCEATARTVGSASGQNFTACPIGLGYADKLILIKVPRRRNLRLEISLDSLSTMYGTMDSNATTSNSGTEDAVATDATSIARPTVFEGKGEQPLVTVGLTTYKAERYVRECLDSLLAQTTQDFEVVIADNASPDRTYEICQEYAARDPRIHVVRADRNLGVAANLNRVFELGRGQFFCWASANDWYAPRFLERCLEPMISDSEVDLVASQIAVFEHRLDEAKPDIQQIDGNIDDDLDRFIACLRMRDGRMFRGVFRAQVVRRMGPLSWRFGQDIMTVAKVSAQGKVRMLDEHPHYFERHAPGTVTHRVPPHQRVSHYEPIGGLGAYVMHRTRNQIELWSIALDTARGASGTLRAIRGMLGVSWRWRSDVYIDLRDVAGLVRGLLRSGLGRV